MPDKKEAIFFTDGASQGNPGPAGIGIVVFDNRGRCIKKISKYIGKVSNNVAEYTALNFALQEALILKFKDITIKTDSELLTKQLNGQYKIKSDNLKPFYLQAKHLIGGLGKVDVVHIKREGNREADKLATLAIKKQLKK